MAITAATMHLRTPLLAAANLVGPEYWTLTRALPSYGNTFQGWRQLHISQATSASRQPAAPSPTHLPFAGSVNDAGSRNSGRATGTTASLKSTALSFEDYQTVFEGKPTVELLRAYLVFRMCGIPAFVRHSEFLIKTSRKLLGDAITYAVIRRTFFRVFCAGETPEEVWATMDSLQKRGVGGILDYVAEDDVSEEGGEHAAVGSNTHHLQAHCQPLPESSSKAKPESKVVARTYAYESEMTCDKHVEVFLSAIDTASKMAGQGFVAIKMTALGNPLLLERVSSSVKELLELFKRFDLDGNGMISRPEFEQVYKQLLPDSTADELQSMFEWFDTQKADHIDYVSWSQRLSIRKIAERVGPGPHPALQRRDVADWQRRFYERLLTAEELDLVDAMEQRVACLAESAVAKGVRLMIDAEHSYFQSGIDHVAHRMMRRFNKGEPYVYNTYQAYLRDAHSRLLRDDERAHREGFKLGVKLVRGAYLELERRRASQLGYASPVWDELHQTHDSYNRCIAMVLEQVAAGRTEVMFGSHNQHSIELAVATMDKLGLSTSSGVYFGQLMGMSDHLSFTLGKHGYKAYKYCSYGTVAEAIPYLLRRATENAYVVSQTKKDLQLIGLELQRRFSLRSWAARGHTLLGQR